MSATPRPWKVTSPPRDPNAHDVVCAETGRLVAKMPWGNYDAELIVRAVNAHDDLIASLRQCSTELHEVANILRGAGLSSLASIYDAAELRVEYALAKARA